VNDQLRDILRIFGLRKYEAAIYLSLMTSGTATAVELSRRASIPLPRIYTSIKSLEKRGYLYRIPGSPSKYRAAHPGHILRAEMSLLRRNLESILLEAEQEYETASSMEAGPEPSATLAFGERGMVATTIGMFQSAQSEIIGILDDASWCCEEEVLIVMKALRKRGVKIRVVGKDSSESAEDFDILRASSGASIRLADPGELKSSFLVRDRTDVMMIAGNRRPTASDQASTVIVSDPNISRVFLDLFEQIWNRASATGGSEP
jgi:sugar-specific transcriptional regulator TrmB